MSFQYTIWQTKSSKYFIFNILFTYPPTYYLLTTYLPTHPPIYLHTHLPIYLLIHPPTHPSTYLPIHPPTYFLQLIYLLFPLFYVIPPISLLPTIL
jgi:hypothetical protein